MLIDDEERTVKLFIENLLRGNIEAKFQDYDKIEDDSDYTSYTYNNILEWVKLSKKENLDDSERQIFSDSTNDVFNEFLEGRINGTITGKLHDEVLDDKINKLTKENTLFAERIAEYKEVEETKKDHFEAVK